MQGFLQARGRDTRQAGKRAPRAESDGADSSALTASAQALIRMHAASDYSRVPVYGAAGLADRLAAQASAGSLLPGNVRQQLETGTGQDLYNVHRL